MKEKKLILPQYYKFIIASAPTNKSSKRLILRSDAKMDSSSFKDKRKLIRKPTIRNKKIITIKNIKKKDTINGNYEKRSIKPEEYKRILN